MSPFLNAATHALNWLGKLFQCLVPIYLTDFMRTFVLR